MKFVLEAQSVVLNRNLHSTSRETSTVAMRWVACRGDAGDAPPSARFGHTATSISRGRYVVVFGGLDKSSGNARGALDDVVVLDVAHDAWFRPEISGATRPSGRAFHSACATSETEILVSCGRDGRRQFGDAWTLDVDSWTWRELSNATTTPRDFASMMSVGDGCVVAFGGFDGKGWMSNVEILRGTSSEDARWSTIDVAPARLEAIDAVTSGGKTAPEPRSGSAMVRYGDNLLIYGGQGANGAAFNDTWCLKREPSGGWRWVKLVLRGSPPTARAGHAMSVVAMGRGIGPYVVVSGGVGDDGWLVKERVYFDDAHFLDGENAKWQRLEFAGEGNGPSSRAYHTLTQVSENKCLCFGGFNGANACNDAWWLVVDDMEYADISSEALASPKVLVSALRDRLPINIAPDVFDGNPSAFRAHIAACDVEDVRLGDVPKLLREYADATAKLGLPERRGEDERGRFRHSDPESIKLSDLGKALTELQGAYIANA